MLKGKSDGKFAHVKQPLKVEETREDGQRYVKTIDRHSGTLMSVLYDSPADIPPHQKPIPYSEKKITDQIQQYNRAHVAEYPVGAYHELQRVSYYALAGGNFYGGLSLRLSLFQNKTLVERSLKTSFTRSISFMQVLDSDPGLWDGRYESGSRSRNFQLLNVMPIGVRLETKHKTVQPYTYFGLGLTLIIETSDYPLPSFSVGGGVKVNMGTWGLLADISPTIFGGANLGLGIHFNGKERPRRK